MNVRFIVRCPEQGPDTTHRQLSTAYKEFRHLQDEGHKPELLTKRVLAPKKFAWGGVN